MIDLSRFSEPKQAIVPIVDGWGKYQGRLIKKKVEDGWYELEIGDTVKVIKKATPLQIEKVLRNEKSYVGFPIGDQFINANFDTNRRKGYTESVRFWFAGNNKLFIPARVVCGEDGRYYFWKDEPGFQREIMESIRGCLERREPISKISGITPEQRYLFILARLYQNSYEAYKELERVALTPGEREKHLANYVRDFGSRIRDVISDAGGTFNSYINRGSDYLVEWTLGGQKVKSIINDDLRIINAGFCLSGEDEKHTISSVIMLAKMFQEESPLYITRE